MGRPSIDPSGGRSPRITVSITEELRKFVMDNGGASFVRQLIWKEFGRRKQREKEKRKAEYERTQ